MAALDDPKYVALQKKRSDAADEYLAASKVKAHHAALRRHAEAALKEETAGLKAAWKKEDEAATVYHAAKRDARNYYNGMKL